MTLLSTDAMGDSPFMITLDGSKKARLAVSVDLSDDKKLAARFCARQRRAEEVLLSRDAGSVERRRSGASRREIPTP